MSISVKPAEPHHYKYIVDYFTTAEIPFLAGMGVDPKKLPTRDAWLTTLHANHSLPIDERSIFYVIWHIDGNAIGHSNINKIVFGDEAYMHLHMWTAETRNRGIGFELVKQSIPYYFREFKLKNLYCEPYALNPAPNKTLEKSGFDLVKEYETIPGAISFMQPVKKWWLSFEKFSARLMAH